MNFAKYFNILDDSFKEIVNGLHPCLQEDIANIIRDLQDTHTTRQINKEVAKYLIELPLDYLTTYSEQYEIVE